MTATTSEPLYSRIDGGDPIETTATGSIVELQPLQNTDKNGREMHKNNSSGYKVRRQPSTCPWQGAAALLFIALLTAAAVGVLLASRGSPIETWSVRKVQIQPQVWLSVLSTIMDGLTMFAVAKAAEMTYWRATARGTTLRNMYDLYESQSIVGAINNLLHLRGDKMAVVSVLCLVSALRGPFFQRASIVDANFMRQITGTQELKVAQLVPPNLLFPASTANITLFDDVYSTYLERTPINASIIGSGKDCVDQCNGKGYGFDMRCSKSTVPWDNSNNSIAIEKYQDSDNHIGGAVPSFNCSASLPNGVSGEDFSRDFIEAEQQGWFEVINLFKNEPLCGGDLSLHSCSLHPAVLEYEVTLRNGTISLTRNNWQEDNVLFQTPSWTFPDLYELSTTVWGPAIQWVSWIMMEFNEEISIYPDGDGGPFAGSNVRNLLARRFINGDLDKVTCNTTFGDPTQFVLNRIREMAFRTAVAAAAMTDPVAVFGYPTILEPFLSSAKNMTQNIEEGLLLSRNWTQEINIVGQKHTVVYDVSMPYLACSIACSLLAVVAIAPLYWNAKNEGLISCSFNPLDVAHRFNAPLLRDVQETNMETYVRTEQGLRRVKRPGKLVEDGECKEAVRIVDEERHESGK